ncbi:MAG TPA: zf-HC2 domain-containing protein [Candidatus Dormibacteraeota bacterium]|nr:zf-HC2 domain-containing protein [Candidatus Dormibacteraeota bacterium]
MQNPPKIVTERLRAAAVPTGHPDADVLTAFSERSLPERERSRVLEHLARCGDCREIVALALPAEEPVAESVHPARSRWLTWPALRWGFVAAGIVAITSVGILKYRQQGARQPIEALYDATRADTAHPESVAKEAKNEAPPVAGEPAKQGKVQIPLPAVAVPDESRPAPKKRERGFNGFVASSQPQSRVAGGAGMTNAPATFGPSVKQQLQQNNFYANNSQQLPAPYPVAPPPVARQHPSNQEVAATPAAPSTAGAVVGGPIGAEKKSQDLDTLAAQNRSAMEPQPSGRSAGAEVARAKPAEATSANAPTPQLADAYSVSAASGTNFVPSAGLAPESARWSISAMGGLQRSVDQGKTWQDVDVNSGSGAVNGARLSMALKSRPSRDKALAKDKADAKEAPPVVFRAVSANGPDVWAGGSAGALYHSTDAGGHWVRVVPSWSEVVLTDDIVSLQFADPLRGRILTSSSEIWTTADAGQTWQKH